MIIRYLLFLGVILQSLAPSLAGASAPGPGQCGVGCCCAPTETLTGCCGEPEADAVQSAATGPCLCAASGHEGGTVPVPADRPIGRADLPLAVIPRISGLPDSAPDSILDTPALFSTPPSQRESLARLCVWRT